MTPYLQITFATSADAREIAEISRTLIEHGLPWRWKPERVAQTIAKPNVNAVVVRDKGGLSGFGIMEYLEDDAHLLLFAVRPESQRQGVGSAMLEWLEASARVAGARRIRIEARHDNLAARNFYNDHGYHEIALRKRMYLGLLDGVLLEKWLVAPN